MKKLAYLIMTYQDPEHLNRMVNALDYNAHFFVHVDKKVDIEPFKQACTLDNVLFLENRITVSWGGISFIDVAIKLMHAALEYDEEYSHLLMLSGSCYPIKPKQEIYDFMLQHEGHEFIKYLDARESPEHYMKSLENKHFFEPFYQPKGRKSVALFDKGLRHALKKLKIQQPWEFDMVPYFGSFWWALTPECCRYVLNFTVEHLDFFRYCSYAIAPEEFYFHTVVGNSVFAANSDGVQEFQGRGTFRMANLHIIDQSLSKWYTIDDWEEIDNSDKLFVRKVNTKRSKTLLDELDKKTGN